MACQFTECWHAARVHRPAADAPSCSHSILLASVNGITAVLRVLSHLVPASGMFRCIDALVAAQARMRMVLVRCPVMP
jgi:hypothetical protein